MNIWDQILDEIQGRVNPQSFATWLRPTSLAKDEGSRILVTVPSQLFANWLTKNYMDLIRESAATLDDTQARRLPTQMALLSPRTDWWA